MQSHQEGVQPMTVHKKRRRSPAWTSAGPEGGYSSGKNIGIISACQDGAAQYIVTVILNQYWQISL